MTTILITHNAKIAEIADKVITIANGQIESIKTKQDKVVEELTEEVPKKKKKKKKKKKNNNQKHVYNASYNTSTLGFCLFVYLFVFEKLFTVILP